MQSEVVLWNERSSDRWSLDRSLLRSRIKQRYFRVILLGGKWILLAWIRPSVCQCFARTTQAICVNPPGLKEDDTPQSNTEWYCFTVVLTVSLSKWPRMRCQPLVIHHRSPPSPVSTQCHLLFAYSLLQTITVSYQFVPVPPWQTYQRPK